ncbi:hypothetical protein B1C78_05345 [Thioalkalivibrio denitrificans]|uniref:PEP-CTERM protein-sorting domain-containing protein n=1 Tax=Thioalkalivibrio denitrificans TaxID=108003 RepID=A0A1V3NMJ6_9GAMM|nr:hypothetical protein [Thioalkalivibrio denitrificans]OOG26173.1 hypothetical protein B1C78_05345 [Thioalkalivibrio denitrificans]
MGFYRRFRSIGSTLMAVCCLLMFSGVSVQAAPITWTDSYTGGGQLISAGQSLSITLDINDGFAADTDIIQGFEFSWQLIDNDADIFRIYRSVPYSYSCGTRFNPRTCTGYTTVIDTQQGQREYARIVGPGFDSGDFEVGNSCQGNACPGNSSYFSDTSFSDTEAGIDLLQLTGLFQVDLFAVSGDFLIGNAFLTVTGLRMASAPQSVSEPGIWLLFLPGLILFLVMTRSGRVATRDRLA